MGRQGPKHFPTGHVETHGGPSTRKFLSGRPARTPEEKEAARQEHLRYQEECKRKHEAEIKRAQAGSIAEKRART